MIYIVTILQNDVKVKLMAGMFKRNLRELRRQTDKNDIEAFSQLQLFTKQSTYQNLNGHCIAKQKCLTMVTKGFES